MRLIPLLQILDGELIKTVRFKPRHYVGDPVNAVRIFNLKEVDELAVVDIGATRTGAPNFELLGRLASQSFVPLAYGGGIRTLEQVDKLFALGVDRIILGTMAASCPALIEQVAAKFGQQAIIASLDVRRHWLSGRLQVTYAGGRRVLRCDPVTYARQLVSHGVGEILLQNVDRDGTCTGLDHDLINMVARATSVPTIAVGGAVDWDDMQRAIRESGASACASGTQFTFYGPYHAVLPSYPTDWQEHPAPEPFCVPHSGAVRSPS
jgi:cyclase